MENYYLKPSWLRVRILGLALSASSLCMQAMLAAPVAPKQPDKAKPVLIAADPDTDPLDLEAAARRPEGIKTVDSLQEALESAYRHNTEIKELQAQVRSTDEKLPQALAGWRPTVYANASVAGEKDIISGSRKENGDGNSANAISGSNFSTVSADVTLQQNLFNGGKTVATTCQAESQVLNARAKLADKEQGILLAAVQAYFGVVAKTAELNYRNSNVTALSKTLEATQDKFNVGEETRTSIAQAQADLEAGKAERDATEAQLLTAVATFERVTGARPGKLKKLGAPSQMPATLKEAIEIAKKNNPAVLAALYQEKADRNAIKVNDADLLPRLDLQGSVGRTGVNTRNKLAGGNTATTNRTNDFTTAQKVSVSLRMPLYEGGAIRGKTRELREIAESSRIAIETKRREIIEKLVEAWETYLSAKANVRSYEAQVKANQVSLEGTRQETLVGSKIVLDVLNAQRALVNSQLSLVRAEQSYYQSAYAVLSFMGQLNALSLKLKVKRYDPKVHYQDVRNSW